MANWRPWIPLQVCIRHINVINDHLAGTVSVESGWNHWRSERSAVYTEDPNPLFDLRIGALGEHADLIRGSLHVWSLDGHCMSLFILFCALVFPSFQGPLLNHWLISRARRSVKACQITED